MRQIIVFWLAFLILCSLASALGVAPSSTDIIFEPGLSKTIELSVINNENRDFLAAIRADGELADYITINTPVVQFSKEDQAQTISFTINLPESFEKGGEHSGSIVILAVPKETQASGVEATLEIHSKLTVTVPYAGKYVEARLIIPTFEKGKLSNFAVEVTNLGTSDITDLQAAIEILGPLNNRLETLTSSAIKLASKEKKLIILEWVPDLNNGNYLARANIVYDQKSLQVEQPFTIGSVDLELISISVDSFKLGGIAKFDIFVKNNWNLAIADVDAVAVIRDGQGKVQTEFKTASADFEPYGTQKLEAYWDTAKVMPGIFNMEITLNYLGKSAQRVFEIVVEQNRISSRLAGGAFTAEGGKKQGINTIVYVLSIAVIALIIIVAIIYLQMVKIRKGLQRKQ